MPGAALLAAALLAFVVAWRVRDAAAVLAIQTGNDGGTWGDADEVGELMLSEAIADEARAAASRAVQAFDSTLPNESNRAAFLMMLRVAEGTADPLGYSALFGHKPRRPRTFAGFEDHPRIAQQFTDGAGRKLWTTAAGAYQFMAASPIPGGGSTKVDTWTRVQRRLGLRDFSPESQDRAALELIREKGALADVDAGRFAEAVAKVRKVWASMPDAGYDQAEKSLDDLRTAYLDAGGYLA